MKLDVIVNDGKYVVHIDDGKLTASRYNMHWRDLCGDNLVYWLAVELAEAREKLVITTEALNVYADSNNWKSEYNCAQNVWHEPDTAFPFHYDGQGTAAKALKEIE